MRALAAHRRQSRAYILILLLWEILGPLVNPIFFSYPSKIAVAFVDLSLSGELLHYLLQSLEVLFYGLGLAIVIGIPVAVLMARVRPVDWALDLPINALYATPMVALVPILVLWFGIYLKAKVLVVFLFAVFPILINTYQGVRECDKNMLEVARSFRSSEWQMWKDVLLPFALPYIAAGIRLAIGRGLVGMVIAEFYTTISGLEYIDHTLCQHLRDGQDVRPGHPADVPGRGAYRCAQMDRAEHRAVEPGRDMTCRRLHGRAR